MNVFVLSTGRCGSTTFSKACSHIENYSSAHESRWGLLGVERLSYPARHIEVDNRLAWFLGRLEQLYGDEAFYVHLTRERNATAASFVRRYHSGIIKAYRGDGILGGCSEEQAPLSVALDYYDTVNTNIQAFLGRRSRKADVRLESIDHDFRAFWEGIGATGDLQSALSEFSIRYNRSPGSAPSGDSSMTRRARNVMTWLGRHLSRVHVRL